MGLAEEDRNRRMLRARDLMDHSYAAPLDVPALARVAHTSPAHFSRVFAATFGESPHRYLQRRRLERAARLLRETDGSVTDVCWAVGFASLGTFSRTFSAVMGCAPAVYRQRCTSAVPPLSPGPGAEAARRQLHHVPDCMVMAWTRVSSSGEADAAARR